MVIKTAKGDIACDRDAVYDVFGITKGETVILYTPSLEKSDFVTLWSKQFQVSSKFVRNKMVSSRITGDFPADKVFIMNVLMLFVNTMVISSGNRYNLDVLHHVDLDVDLRSYDWCGFVLHYLKLSKQYWDRNSPYRNPYYGPATFLCLLYLDRTKCDSLPVIRERPIFKNLVGLMKARENKEVAMCSFGQLDLFPIVSEKEKEDEGFFANDELKHVSSYSKEVLLL
uniref:uncharacterized protein LOC122604308 n=1 Tax=Erigeron canadensis TaxID=72917 RepID=UPI001CB95F1E|nr:uncharacterized protein LOC122604308 [Erigeron canadensis]